MSADIPTGVVRILPADEVMASLSPAEAVDAITDALIAGVDPALDLPRAHAPTSHGHFLLMPSQVGTAAGIKVATVAPGNPARGLPRIQASYLLLDSETLTLRAILDGTALTTLRTPAVSVAAIRPALDAAGSPVWVVIFGGGPQAVSHAQTLTAVTAIDRTTFVVRRPDQAGPTLAGLGDVVEMHSDAALCALADADVVVCATSARTPLFEPGVVRAGTIVVAVGSHEPDARELPAALLGPAQVIVEDPATALREAGDVIQAVHEGVLADHTLIPMREVVRGERLLEGRTVVFKSVGMSWQDLVIAEAVMARSSALSTPMNRTLDAYETHSRHP